MAYLVALLVFALAWLAPTSAHAGPALLASLLVSLLSSLGATSLAASLGATLFAVGSFAVTGAYLISSVAIVAIGIGLAILFAPRVVVPPGEAGVIAVMQTIPYRVFAFGRTRLGGAIMLKEESAGYLLYVAALTGHFADGLESLFLNDDPVVVAANPIAAGSFVVGIEYSIVSVGTTDFTAIGAASNTIGVLFTATGVGTGTGTATAVNLLFGNVIGLLDGRYQTSITVDSRQGLIPETAYANIIALISEWTVAHRGDGQSSIAMECLPVSAQNFTQTYPYASPAPSVVLRGARVFDPRDGTQNPNNPATFKWSQNPALNIIHWLCFSEFGFQYKYSVAILPFQSFWIQAANDCDDLVSLKSGGSEPRYQLGGWATSQSARVTTLLTLLQACDGFLSHRGSGYVLYVGKYYTPIVTITDNDICGFDIQTDVASEDKVNIATGQWTSPANAYVTVDTDPVVNTIDQAAREGAPRKAQLAMTWVQSNGQASRLLVREMFRQSVPVRGTLTLLWSGLNAPFERFIAVDSNTIPMLSGAVIENRNAIIHPKTRTVDIQFILSGPALDAYDPTTQESAPPYVPQRPATVSLPIPANLAAVPVLITDSSGASSVVIDVSWDEPFYNSAPWVLNYQMQYRQTNGETVGVTITLSTGGSPAVFTLGSAAPADGTTVSFYTFGSLPPPMVVGQNYFVIAASGDSFQIANTVGGSPLVTTGPQSGSQIVTISDSTPGPWTTQSITTPTIAALRVMTQTNVVASGTFYDIEVAATGLGQGSWSQIVTVSTNLATIAPQPPVWIAAIGGSGSAALSVTSPNSANFAQVQFYRVVSGGPFSAATAIGSPVTGSRNSTISYTDLVGAGTWDYFAVSENSSEVASDPAGPEPATVT